MRRLLCFAAALLVCALAAISAHAQSQATTAQVTGVVTDTQGGVLPGATVTITSPDTGYTRTAVSNAEGFFSLSLVPPGTYDLGVELAGFTTAKRSLILTVGATVTANTTMQVGAVTETVTVTSESPLVETSATVRTTTVDGTAIANLPINGRRFQDFIASTPTVQVDPSRGQLSFAGQRGINANVSVDGADYNQPFFGGIRGGERIQQRLHRAAGVDPGVPGRRRRLLRRVRPLDRRPGQRDHQVGHEPPARLGLLRQPQPRLGREQRVRPERRADPAAVRRVDRRPDHQGPICSSSAPTSSRSSRTRASVPVRSLAGFTPGADQPGGVRLLQVAREPFDATNDAIDAARPGRLSSWPAANRVSACATATATTRRSTPTRPATRSTRTRSARSPTTAPRRTAPTRSSASTPARFGTNLLFEARGQYAREERPREANDPLRRRWNRSSATTAP